MELPLQLSATSQGPAADRQLVPAGCLASAGQVSALPLQLSAASQTPPEARHCVPAGRGLQAPGAVGRLHAWQSFGSPPPQAALQHTPSTQMFDWQ